MEDDIVDLEVDGDEEGVFEDASELYKVCVAFLLH